MNRVKNIEFFNNIKGKNIIPIEKSIIKFYHLFIVFKGKFTYIINGKEVILEDNDAILMPSGTDRARLYHDEYAEFVIFNFIPVKEHEISTPIIFKNALNRPIEQLLNAYPYTFYHHQDNLKYASKKYLEYTAHDKNKEKAILHNVLNCILIELFDFLNYKTKNPHVINIIKYIDSNITTTLTLNGVAQGVHLSKEYTARVFKKEMDMTVTEYINRQKLSLAKDMLTSNQLTLQEISERLGYRNYNYFSRLFKEQYGISPIKLKSDFKKY